MAEGRTMVSPVNGYSSRVIPATPRQDQTHARPNAQPSAPAQTGRETAAPLSGIRTQAAGAGSRGFAAAASAATAISQSAMTKAEEIIRATGTGQPSVEGSRIAHEAYIMEIQAQQQGARGSMRGIGMREWSA